LSLMSHSTAASVKKPELGKLFYFVLKGVIITGFFLLGEWICNPSKENALFTFVLYLSVLGLLNSGDIKEILKRTLTEVVRGRICV
jgi:hypothetical protein